jgi:hypothetical protein
MEAIMPNGQKKSQVFQNEVRSAIRKAAEGNVQPDNVTLANWYLQQDDETRAWLDANIVILVMSLKNIGILTALELLYKVARDLVKKQAVGLVR